MNKNRTSEKGQAIILLVFAVIGLVGLTALAIDGGMVYSDRRHAQSASDAASLAGGGFAALGLENYGIYYENFDCDSPEFNPNVASSLVAKSITSAELRAYSNDYIDEEVTVTVACNDCECSGDEKYLDFTTQIRRRTKTSLVHFVYDGDVINEVVSTVRVRPRSPFLLGNAIVALNTDNCQGQQNGATFHGNVDVEIETGGIWSNGCLRGNGGPDVNVHERSINYVGEVIGANLFDPSPTHVPEPFLPEDFSVPQPDCSHPDAHNVNANAIDGEIASGLYCISGDVRINAHDEVIGEGVTLYLLDGRLVINGNATVQITAPEGSAEDVAPALPGILVMTAPGNNSRLQINGNSESIFTGTILAPESDIDFLGNGHTNSYNTQIIGWNVQAGGTADLYVTFYDNRDLSTPSSIDMKE